MLRRLALIGLLLALPAFALPVPKPSGGGDYWVRDENTWLDWVVVTPELVGRLTPSWPLDDSSPEALIGIDWVVYKWPVVAKFFAGQRLRAVPDECGGILIKDIDGGTWMKVERGNGSFCFVRANAKYIKPAQPESPKLAKPVPANIPPSPAPATDEPARPEIEPVLPEVVEPLATP